MFYDQINRSSSVAEGCPWYDMAQSFGPPNVKWCEETLCSWVNEPANTWSNLLYIAMALWIFYSAKRKGSPSALWIGVALFFTGSFSFVYHMSNNFLTQFLDFLGMFLLTGTLVTLNLKRIFSGASRLVLIGFFGFFVLVFCGLTLWGYRVGYPIQELVMVNIVLILLTEALAKKRTHHPTRYTYYILGLLTLALAQFFSLLDLKRMMCDPHNHWLQGHALWHIVAALAIGFVYMFYLQFDDVDIKPLEEEV